MTTRNQNFGFANPFGTNAARRPQRQQQPQNQYDYEEQPQEQDPMWETQAYMKIGFRLNNGKTKFLKLGKTDKQLRLGSPLEAMILKYWAEGGDLNELVSTMVIEINDANEDIDENLDFDFAPKQAATPVKPKRTRATAQDEE